jgi:hypothetical protein
MCPWPASPSPYLLVVRSRGTGRVLYRLTVYGGLHISFHIEVQYNSTSIIGPMFLWAFTRIYPRYTNMIDLGSHNLVSGPEILSES